MKTCIYEMPCPGCGKKVRRETSLGVSEEMINYELKYVDFECPDCKTKFTISLKPEVPEIQARWEVGEDMG